MSERALRAVSNIPDDDAMWKLIATGDLGNLNDKQKTTYYLHLCESLGVNPATQPFEYMNLNGKQVLYAKPTLTDQLRKLHGVSVIGQPTIEDDGEYITAGVTVQDATGRTDYDIGCVFVGTLKGEARANAKMKSLTKAKRRATLRICGMSALDETEVETIPGARPVAPIPHPTSAQESQPQRPVARPSQESEAVVEVEGRVVDAETGEVVEATERVVDERYSWSAFWLWARGRGLNDLKAVTALIGRSTDGLSPAEVRDLILAARGEVETPPPATAPPAEAEQAPVDMSKLHGDINAKLKALPEVPQGANAHIIAHDLALVWFDLPSLTQLDADWLRKLHARVGKLQPDEMIAAWHEAQGAIADRMTR